VSSFRIKAAKLLVFVIVVMLVREWKFGDFLMLSSGEEKGIFIVK